MMFAVKLLERRGFEKTGEGEEHEDYLDIFSKSTKPRSKETLLLRVFLGKDVIGVEILRNLVKAQEDGDFTRAVLIGGERYTYAARREAKEKNVELLHRRFLSIDLFMHVIVPEHDVVPEDEVEEVETKYGISRHQLPKIKAGDPAAKAIGARPGDVIRVIRESPTAGRHEVYRYCVP
jgi:DNA-directed RNA polymerase subunit H